MNTNITKRVIAATSITICLAAPGATPAQATTEHGSAGGETSGAKRADPRSAAEVTYDARPVDFAVEPGQQRYRDSSRVPRHVHDSWNPCHIGEDVPKRLQGSGPGCWSRLPGHTGR